MIAGKIKFDLPEVLSEPKTIKNFFSPELFERVKSVINNLGMGPNGNLKFHPMLARWESHVSFDEEIETYCLNRARQIFNDNTLKKAYFFACRYQRYNQCIPHLWEHVDQNGTQTTIDITIENTADWGLIVENELFKQEPNDAIVFCGQQQTHSRPPYPTKNEDAYVTMLFLHFTDPNHWIQNGGKIQEYGKDGDIRFFNRNGYFALPDPPINQEICECHDYSGVLGIYQDILNNFSDVELEPINMAIESKNEIAPGILKYSIPKSSAKLLKGLVQNSMMKQWTPAEVLIKDKERGINQNSRNCYNYFLTEKQSSCHPYDPIRRLAESLKIGMDAIAEDFRGRYSIIPLVSHHTVLLRYEEGNKFANHIDDHSEFPRVVSMSLFLNDDYRGGELVFNEFEVAIKPQIGDVIVFCSSFPYMHEVKEIVSGIRYAVVKWYSYKNEK